MRVLCWSGIWRVDVSWLVEFYGTWTLIGYKISNSVYTYILNIYYLFGNHHHHHVVPPARISLTLSRQFSLSFIASCRSSVPHPVSSYSCCMYVRAGRPAFARPYVGVHRSTSLMSSSLIFQQCSACLVRLTWMVFVAGNFFLTSQSSIICSVKWFQVLIFDANSYLHTVKW